MNARNAALVIVIVMQASICITIAEASQCIELACLDSRASRGSLLVLLIDLTEDVVFGASEEATHICV